MKTTTSEAAKAQFFPSAAGELERVARGPLEIGDAHGGVVDREQDFRGGRGDFQRERDELLEIALHLEGLAALVAREGGRVEHDGVELFPAPRQPGQHGEHVVRDEAMAYFRVEPVAREVPSPRVRERREKIHAERFRADQRGATENEQV
jgi:hypothetical protein